MSKTRVNLILHAHSPYVRHLEYPKFLEENWFFEDLCESYIPLLKMLEKHRVTSFCAPPTVYRFLIKEDLDGYRSGRRLVYTVREHGSGERSLERILRAIRGHDYPLEDLEGPYE